MAVVPRVIWCFWHDGRPPPLVAACLANTRRQHPDWDVRLLTDADLPADRPDVRALGPQHRADWLRLWVLDRGGGVWLDAAIVCFRPVTAWFDLTDAVSEVQCFRLTDRHPRVLENWALACPAGGSRFVAEWFREFDGAVRMGLAAYQAALEARPGGVPEGLPGPMNGAFALPYLTMHAAGAVVLERLPDARVRASLATKPPGPFAPHVAARWSVPVTVHRLLHDRTLDQTCPMLKLRGHETGLMSLLLRAGWFDPHAAVVRQLRLTDPDVGYHGRKGMLVLLVMLLPVLMLLLVWGLLGARPRCST